VNVYLCMNSTGLKTQFKRFFDFLLFGNVYVALGALCLVQSTVIQLQLTSVLIPYSLLVFFATLFIYNFQRIFYVPQENTALHSVRRAWIFRNPVIIKALACIGFTGVLITFFYVDFHIVFYLSPLLALSLAYFTPFVKLRKNAFFKLLTLVIVWTVATAVVPILLAQQSLLNTKNGLHLLIRFCFMTAICIPFDIRDLKIDEADHISTLPRILGENRTRRLAFTFMIAYIGSIVLAHYLNYLPVTVFMMLLLSAILNTLLVVMSSSKRSEYFFTAGIDGTMILQGMLLIATVYL
jgi:4-hydroxybenzoate polyprenyltransferase